MCKRRMDVTRSVTFGVPVAVHRSSPGKTTSLLAEKRRGPRWRLSQPSRGTLGRKETPKRSSVRTMSRLKKPLSSRTVMSPTPASLSRPTISPHPLFRIFGGVPASAPQTVAGLPDERQERMMRRAAPLLRVVAALRPGRFLPVAHHDRRVHRQGQHARPRASASARTSWGPVRGSTRRSGAPPVVQKRQVVHHPAAGA